MGFSYSPEFKEAALQQIREGKGVRQVAKILKVDRGNLYLWCREAGITFKKNRQFSEEFKRAIVLEYEAGATTKELAQREGFSQAVVTKWARECGKRRHEDMREAERIEELKDRRQKEEAEKKREAAKRRREARQEELRVQEAKRREEEIVREASADAITWMQKYTKTRDSHWRENGADSPYRHLPDREDRPQFRVMLHDFTHQNPYFVPKSRDMLVSWTLVGIFTHKAITTAGIDICFQSQKQEKANELVEYAKILYEQSDEAIKKAYPLDKKVQAVDQLCFANGSRIIAIPGGGDQIRSYHPWGLLMDEAAFMPEAGDSFNIAVPVCKKIVVVSSAGPGWFAETVSDRDETQNDEEFEEKAALYRAIQIVGNRD